MLDAVNADGSPGGPDEFLDSTLNVTNRLDPGSMGQVIVENILEELDAPNEYYVDEDSNVLYLSYNGTGKPPSSLKLGDFSLSLFFLHGFISRSFRFVFFPFSLRRKRYYDSF
jgi:hypothetical protein